MGRRRREPLMRIPIFITAVLCLALLCTADSSPPVQVQLRSPWSAPPLLHQILEAAYEEEPSSFFPLVTHLTSPWAFTGVIKAEDLSSKDAGKRLREAREEDVHAAARRILDERELLMERGQRDNWELNLALRSQSPKVAAFWQMYETTGMQKRWEAAEKEGDCESWVDFAGKVICTEKDLIAAIESYDWGNYTIIPALVPFDHVFTSASTHHIWAPTAVLYADPFSPHFWSLHQRLMEYALGSRIGDQAFRYVLRWKPIAGSSSSSSLAGYGAFLDLKKVDYLVIDDRKLTDTSATMAAGKEGPDGGAEEDARRQEEDQRWISQLLKKSKKDERQSIGNLEEKELEDLAIKAAYTVVKSKDPLRSLRLLSQDFPQHAVALARSAPKPTKSFFKELVDIHQTMLQGGMNEVWLNGKVLSAKEFQPYGLLPILRSERSLVNALTALNISTVEAVNLLTSSEVAATYAPEENSSPLFDASDRIERASASIPDEETAVITYWNDLERGSDPRYAKWSPDLRNVLRPMYPGSFPVVRRNLFNIILAMDLEQVKSCKFLSDSVAMGVSRLAIRWGFVPTNIEDPQSVSSRLARFYWLAFDKTGPQNAAKYLRRVVASSEGEKVDLSTAEKELKKILGPTDEPIEDLLSQYDQRADLTKSYVRRLRADESEEGHMFVNGQHMPFGPHVFQFMHQAIAAQVQTIAPQIYYEVLKDDDDVSTYFYDLPTTYTSRSELIFPPPETNTKTKAVQISAAAVEGQRFIYPKASQSVNSTVWVVGDLDSKEGAKLVRDLTLTLDSAHSRLGLVHSPSIPVSSSKQPSLLLSTFLHSALKSSAGITSIHLMEVLDSYAGERDNLYDATTSPDQVVLEDTSASINYVKAQGWAVPEASEAEDFWSGSPAIREALGVDADAKFAINVNGKVISGFNPATLSSSDYLALLQKEAGKADVVKRALAKASNVVDASMVARAASVLGKAYFVDASLEGIFDAPSTVRSTAINQLPFKETTFSIGNRDTATLRFTVLIEPISEMAQRWSSVLDMLSSFEDVYIQVILNPTSHLRELPIKRYYRYSAPAKLSFDLATGQSKDELLSFRQMPLDAVLTMGLDAPPSWLTMASEAIYDLDNIRLKDVVTPSVSATYDLKYILIEGHARDEVTKVTPRGLQIVLETMDGAEQLDTIVMQNLAYFQFRAKPGLYRLRLRPGRSANLFDMLSVGNAGLDSPPVSVTGDSITLSTLHGLTIYPRLAKKKGKEKEILVEDESVRAEPSPPPPPPEASAEEGAEGKDVLSRAKGLLNSVTGFASSAQQAVTSLQQHRQKETATINVFTVASGHLYERMTYIMILSVLKHTNSTVKFWFIENFLSPSFKDFIPHLAREYNFDYELITYAWPHWLRGQKEKQRSIWGMKVLFLDVLFPLQLDKVIFVDADQIVRVDLKELIDLDLHGAPYGFPPMGNDSFDMDNFRFWEQPGGYWQKFLGGKPYPISALFVVDLNRFRLQAAGDKLRGNYQALTQDPNSLSNLDQDLVASMIHVVNIFSLPKEWLWCETWCSWDWYDQAKSIDLCSNPKTKEPKLDRAKRQIPEWTVYDDEVARAALKFKDEGKLGANVVAPAQQKEEQKTAEMASPASTAADPIPQAGLHDEL